MLPDASVRRVLIYRLGSLGDMMVALPCFHLIERVFPGAERRLLTNFPIDKKAPTAAAVLDGSGLIHGYMPYSVGTRSPIELVRLAAEIRRYRPDVLIYLTHVRSASAMRRDRVFLRFAGLRRFVGMRDERSIEHRFDFNSGLYESEAARLARRLTELGSAHLDDSDSWDLRLTESEQNEAADALAPFTGRPLIVCGPGTKMPAKDWGCESWRALLGRIGARYTECALALVGAGEDAAQADHAAELWPGTKKNLCGLSPRAMAAVMSHADIFLGPDSGPMHVAAAAGARCVIAFAATQLSGVWFPHGQHHQIVYHRPACAGCRLEICSAERRRCMTSITIDEMEAAVVRALRSESGVRAITRIA